MLIADEVAEHLHPVLQATFFPTILDHLPPGGVVLGSTHSPAMLLADGLMSSWWMDDAGAAGDGNQLSQVGRKATIATRIFDLYAGCSTAEAVPEILTLAQEEEFGRFVDECFDAPGVVGIDGRTDTDTQVANIRDSVATLLSERAAVSYLDFGCGAGRCLKAFEAFSPEQQARMTLHMVDADAERLRAARMSLRPDHAFAGVLFATDLNGIRDVDYAVLANVFHEIVGVPLVEALALIWNALRPGGMVHVLEMAELIVGEKGFLSLSAKGYEVLFGGLDVEHPVVHPYPTRSGMALLAARAARPQGPPVDEDFVRAAYIAALEVTRADCLQMLAGDVRGSRRAFWLENLASVDRTLDELRRHSQQ